MIKFQIPILIKHYKHYNIEFCLTSYTSHLFYVKDTPNRDDSYFWRAQQFLRLVGSYTSKSGISSYCHPALPGFCSDTQESFGNSNKDCYWFLGIFNSLHQSERTSILWAHSNKDIETNSQGLSASTYTPTSYIQHTEDIAWKPGRKESK